MRFSFIIALFLIPLFAFAQIDYEKRAKEYFKVRNYERALKDYSRALRKKPDDLEIIENMILCYFNSNADRSEAMELIETLEKRNPKHKQLQLFYARAAFHSNQFEKAFTHITQYKKEAKLDEDELKEVESLTNYILTAQALIKKPLDVSFINLGDLVNSDRSEINPFVSDDETVLFFGSDKKYLSAMSINYYNVCISLMQDTAWEKRKYIGSKVNSIYDEIPAGLSGDGKTLFVFHNKYGDQTLASAPYLEGYRLEYLTDLGMPINTNGSEYGACVSPGGDTLYYAAEMEDGQTDIMYSIKLPTGEWGFPREIPGMINTAADENFPNISADGKKLVFSSNGKNSMGGYDLFYSYKNAKTGEWGEPVNMGYPLNDTYDNFNISMPKNKRYGYVSAVRHDSKGLRDIYKVVFNNEEIPTTLFKYQIVDELQQPYVRIRPSVQLWNKDHDQVVGRYACSPETAKFVVAVTPGEYHLEVLLEGEVAHTEMIKVKEKMVGSPVYEKQIKLIVNNENADHK